MPQYVASMHQEPFSSNYVWTVRKCFGACTVPFIGIDYVPDDIILTGCGDSISGFARGFVGLRFGGWVVVGKVSKPCETHFE